MQQSSRSKPLACCVEKAHRVRNVFEQVIYHYDIEQVVTGKRLKRTAIHADAAGCGDAPAGRRGYIAPAGAVPLRACGRKQRPGSNADLKQLAACSVSSGHEASKRAAVVHPFEQSSPERSDWVMFVIEESRVQ